MIRGLVPLIFLWILVTGSWASWTLVWLTRWWETLVGQVLWFYIGSTALWWTTILIGSYTHAGPPRWLQLAQVAVFGLKAIGVVWLAFLMLRARTGPLTKEDDNR